MAEALKKDELSRTLWGAAWNGMTSTVQELVEKGADVNWHASRNRTPLHAALAQNNNEAAMILIEHDADVHIADTDGWTPLHYACMNGTNKDIVMALIDQGADLTATDNRGLQPLDHAPLPLRAEVMETISSRHSRTVKKIRPARHPRL